MREIKLRAWDGTKMITPAFVWNKLSCQFYNQFHDKWMFGTKHENIILMQYTGLNDKSRKEIYEGDILKYWDGEKGRDNGVVIFNKGSFVASAIFDKGRFVASAHHNIFCKILDWWDLTVPDFNEIIGNIYENPKLLQEETK